MHKNIVVVGYDGTDASQSALEWAAGQAEKRGARLHLVCAFEIPRYVLGAIEQIPASSRDHLLESAKNMLDRAAESVWRNVEVTYVLEIGDPTDVLTEISKDVALIVVGGRSTRSRFSDRLLKTVATALPAMAYCPTVVVPYEESNTFQPVSKVLVGVDGSEHGRLALERGLWEAKRWGASLDVISAIPSIVTPSGRSESVVPETVEAKKTEIRKELKLLDIEFDGELNIRIEMGNPAYKILEHAQGSDLVVVGTRGRGGIAGLLLGSTSQMVLSQATVPVMIVPKRIRPGDDLPPTGVD